MASNAQYGHNKICQICTHTPLIIILSLGHQAPVHAHLTGNKLNEPEILYPLNLCQCSNCGLLQLDYMVDPKILFYLEYPYFTSMTNMLIEDFKNLRDELLRKYPIGNNDLVIDIGSNDGTLLSGFKEKGLRVLGIEPTNVAKVAAWGGIPTIQDFFNEDLAKKIVQQYGPAKIVTSTNVFAHIYDVFGILRGIDTILAPDGVFVSESQYVLDIIEKLALDTIYHEHLRFYCLKPMMKLLSSGGFSLVDAERIPAAGGSIRVYAEKGNKPPSDRVKELIRAEEEAGLYDTGILRAFADRAERAGQKLKKILLKCKEDGCRIVGIGAPGRSNTLLQFAHIDNKLLDYAVEKKGSPKIGLFTPGTHLPIVDEEMLLQEQPEYALLLSWHIGPELMKKLRSLGYRGKFIIPLPEPRIVDDI